MASSTHWGFIRASPFRFLVAPWRRLLHFRTWWSGSVPPGVRSAGSPASWREWWRGFLASGAPTCLSQNGEYGFVTIPGRRSHLQGLDRAGDRSGSCSHFLWGLTGSLSWPAFAAAGAHVVPDDVNPSRGPLASVADMVE